MSNNKIKSLVKNISLTTLGYFIVIVTMLLIIIIIIYPANSTKFSCQRNADHQVTCQRKERVLYGLIGNSKITFPLQAVEIRKRNKYVCLEDKKENDTFGYTDCIHIYQLYLQSEQQWFVLEEKVAQGYLQSDRKTFTSVKQKQQEIENLINGAGNPFYEYVKVDHCYWIILIVLFFSSVFLWDTNKMNSEIKSLASEDSSNIEINH